MQFGRNIWLDGDTFRQRRIQHRPTGRLYSDDAKRPYNACNAKHRSACFSTADQYRTYPFFRRRRLTDYVLPLVAMRSFFPLHRCLI